MKYLDLSFEAPAQNLACDEVLLDHFEKTGGEGVLRFWESPSYFIVLGYSNKHQKETRWSQSQKEEIPILRRVSGGGTVIQGPGCLNYSLVLKILPQGPSRNLKETNCFIMKRHEAIFSSILGNNVAFQGDTDLTWKQLKFSGNSQKRGKNYLLFHGTVLLNFNLPIVEKYLATPSRQPAYRNNRSHQDFLINTSLSSQKVKEAFRKMWQTQELFNAAELEREIKILAEEKYSTDTWNFKY